MSTGVVILGSHVYAEEVADLLSDCADLQLRGFVENWDRARCAQRLLGHEIVWIDDAAHLADSCDAICAIGTTRRRGFVESAAQLGFAFATLRHPSAVVASSSAIGAGSIVGAGVMVGSHTTVGDHVILNRGVLLGHHSSIGDFVTVSPGSNIAGCVTVGDGVYIGMGAVVLDRISIGAHSLVAAGSLVTRDVPEHVEVRGSPARIVRERVDGR